MLPPKPSTIRGVDFDAQGIINGQPTYEHDILNAYKDEEKPWKKPGADITDYFNYGFTEEIWAQYCDRQRRLRADNNLSRLNVAHVKKFFQFLIIFFIFYFSDATNATYDSRSSSNDSPNESSSYDDD
jgi:hypothetical protein